MPVIIDVPDVDCDGCRWITRAVVDMDMSTEAVDGIFGGRFIHESQEVQVLAERSARCPVHGSRGYK